MAFNFIQWILTTLNTPVLKVSKLRLVDFCVQNIMCCLNIPNRSLGVYFLKMIFDPAFKWVQQTLHIFPSLHLSMVEWQVLVTLFMSSITWLKANMFIKAYGLHSLTKLPKCFMWEDNEHDEYTVNDQL